MTEPLIYTTQGNVPCRDLRIDTLWDIQDGYIKLTINHYRGDELVRSDVHVYDKQGLGAGAVAGSF